MSTFVCLKIDNTLHLATDSRFMASDLVSIFSDSKQKIFEIGSQMLLASCGWNMACDFQVKRARALVRELGTADIRVVSEALVPQMLPCLRDLIELLRSNPHNKIKKILDGQGPVHISLLVGRTAMGDLGYIVKSYKVQDGLVMCETAEEYFGKEGKLTTSGGNELAQLIKEDPKIVEGEPVDIVRKVLVGLKRLSPLVGGADQIVTLNDTGVHWVSQRSKISQRSNQGLEIASVTDSKIVSMGFNKVTYGTSVFAGDVVLSRGVSLPVMVLSNTGLYLFGQADASTGATGLTSKPYVAIQSSGIGVYSGGLPSVTVFATGITLWSSSGNTSLPYVGISSTGLLLANGNYSVAVTAFSVKLMNSAYNNSVVLTGAGVWLYSVDGNPAFPYVNITSGGVTIVGGVLSSPTINGGALTITGGAFTASLNTAICFKVTSLLNSDITQITDLGFNTHNNANTASATMIMVHGSTEEGQLWLSGSGTGTTNIQIRPETRTSANSGSALSLPFAPAGYLRWMVGGANVKVPYYAD